jgi:hypothetical protein
VALFQQAAQHQGHPGQSLFHHFLQLYHEYLQGHQAFERRIKIIYELSYRYLQVD